MSPGISSVNLTERKIYRFDPGFGVHYFICITSNDKETWFGCCTSQRNANLQRILNSRGDLDTLVFVGNAHPFTKDTYVNCNSAHLVDTGQIKNMIDKNGFKSTGVFIDDHVFRAILKGIVLSRSVSRKLQKIIENKYPALRTI